jgi:beta-phosphoglucomutase
MPIEPRAVIWDVDGTLVDTAELHFASWVRLAGEMGRPFSRDDFAATFGRRNPEIIRFLFRQEFSDAEVLEIGERKETYYRAAAEQGVRLLPGVREMLAGLHARGVRQAVGSSAPRGNLDLILRLTDSRQYFDVIVGMEDTQRGKPDPQVFLVAAEKLGVPPRRCVVFEDAVAGVEAAKAGGMMCVAVTFVGHHPAEKLRAAGADRVVRSFSELSPDDVIGLIA